MKHLKIYEEENLPNDSTEEKVDEFTSSVLTLFQDFITTNNLDNESVLNILDNNEDNYTLAIWLSNQLLKNNY